MWAIPENAPWQCVPAAFRNGQWTQKGLLRQAAPTRGDGLLTYNLGGMMQPWPLVSIARHRAMLQVDDPACSLSTETRPVA